MEIEFLVKDNQGTRPIPNAQGSVRIAKTLIQQEDVIAILCCVFKWI